MEQKETLLRYAFLKGEISKLEEEIDMLKPAVEEIVATVNPTDKIVEVDNVGTFSLVGKRKYKYTEATEALADSLKEAKKNEEATGAATYTELPYVLFKSAVIE
jgi:hypothetical protein